MSGFTPWSQIRRKLTPQQRKNVDRLKRAAERQSKFEIPIDPYVIDTVAGKEAK